MTSQMDHHLNVTTPKILPPDTTASFNLSK